MLTSGSALAVNWADEHVPAILQAWYPGESGGAAVAAMLAGDFSPAGRLPVTFYRSAADLPPFDSYAMRGRTYRYFAGEALYPFGYGLSYSQFRYANASASMPPDGTARIAVDVTNGGGIDADEVVQLYVSHHGVAAAPLRELKGFRRIHLKRQETQTVQFVLSPEQLAVVDAAGKRQLEPGQIDVWVGGGQQQARAGVARAAGTGMSLQVTHQATFAD